MINISVELPVSCPLAELEPYLRKLDGSGVHRVWVPDVLFAQWEQWTAAAVAVTSTTQLNVGVGVTSPYHRSPAVIAHAAATLDNLSSGRICLSLGRGMRPFLKNIGIESTDAGVEEGVEIIRQLLHGEKVTFHGEQFHFENIQLPLRAFQEKLPIHLAGMSEKWMEVASKVADGIHTYSVNRNMLQVVGDWAERSPRPDFSIITTVAYFQDDAARNRWLGNMSRAEGLLAIMGIGSGEENRQELMENLILSDADDLARKAESLERLGASELMVACHRADDLLAVGEFVKQLA